MKFDENLVKEGIVFGRSNILLVHNTDKMRFEIRQGGSLVNYFKNLKNASAEFDLVLRSEDGNIIFDRENEYWEV